jgi:hypothetical protein
VALGGAGGTTRGERRAGALQSSTTWVWDMVLERPDGSFSLAASLSSAVELIDHRIDIMAANGVR